MIVYVSIGNSDDKLAQHEWHDFCTELIGIFQDIRNRHIHGVWWSEPSSMYQNMCICVGLPELYASAPEIYLEDLKTQLGILAKRYGQDCISWAEVCDQIFIEPDVRDEDLG